jgi:hypothetical protein
VRTKRGVPKSMSSFLALKYLRPRTLYLRWAIPAPNVAVLSASLDLKIDTTQSLL